MKTILIILLSVVYFNSFGQTAKEKLQERIANKVDLFSSEESENLHAYYEEQIKEMSLSKDLEESYRITIEYYTNKMGRLDTKEKQFTDSEIKTKFDLLVGQLNVDMQDILDDNQYKKHLEAFDKIIYSVYTRKGWKK